MLEQVDWFAKEMDKRIKENDEYRGAYGWYSTSSLELYEGLQKNAKELGALLEMNRDDEEIVKTAADLANYAMMLVDKRR